MKAFCVLALVLMAAACMDPQLQPHEEDALLRATAAAEIEWSKLGLTETSGDASTSCGISPCCLTEVRGCVTVTCCCDRDDGSCSCTSNRTCDDRPPTQQL